MLPSRFTIALVIPTVGVAAISGPVCAADLYVAGTIGEVYRGDTINGDFQQFGGICLGAVQALATDDDYIYAGDESGAIIPFALEDGAYLDFYFLPAGITAMVMDGTELVVGDQQDDIHRVNPATGEVLTTFSSPIDVQAMLIEDGVLYVAGTIGEVYHGDPQKGNLELFGGLCLAPIQALAIDDDHIYAGDMGGGIVLFDRATGELDNVYFVQDGITAMVMDGGDLLVSAFNGTIRRLDAADGTVLDTLTAPITIESMHIGPTLGDLDGDHTVGVTDLLELLAAWGPCGACAADFDDNGFVTVADLLFLLAHWG